MVPQSVRLVSRIAVLVLCVDFVLTAQEQPRAVMTLASSIHVAQVADSIQFEITLRNSSQDSFYISGTVSPGLITPYGEYNIEFRKFGSERS